MDIWVTTDKRNQLNFWDLEKEEYKFVIKSEYFAQKNIASVVEVGFLELVSVGSSQGLITIWDFLG
jgi:autonomous glycyl radical cofactor GrcA